MNSNKTHPVRSTFSATRPLARSVGTSFFATSARLLLAVALAVFAAALAPQPAAAGTYYWDANGTTSGFGTASGTWGTSAYWSTDGTGVAAPGSYTTTTSDSINFGNGGLGLAAGTIAISGTQNAGNITFASGSGAIVLSTGSLGLASPSTISVNNSAGDTISGNITSGGITLSAGTLTLSGNNSYTGETTVNSGATLKAGSLTGLTGNITISSGATLNVDGRAGTMNLGTLTIGGTGSGSGGAIYNGSSVTPVLNCPGGIILTADTTIQSTSGGGSSNPTLNGNISGNYALTLSSAYSHITLLGSNSYTGGTLTSGGPVVHIGNTNALGTGTFTIGGGTLDVYGTTDVSMTANNPMNWNGNFAFAGNGNLNLGTGAVAMNASRTVTCNGTTKALTVGGVISDSSSGYAISKLGTGTLVLTGANTYGGGTYNTAGILEADNSSALGTGDLTMMGGVLSNNVSSTLANNITLNTNSTVGVGSGKTLNLGGTISDNGSGYFLNKVGAGTLVLSGTASYSGVTLISGGALALGSSASTATLNLNNTLIVQTNGAVVMRISKTGGSSANDKIQGLTTMVYSYPLGNSTLTVTNVTTDSTALTAGDTFQLFSASSYVGGFGTLNLPTLPAGLSWDVSGLATSGTIAVTAANTAPTPAFNPVAGTYISPLSVTISSEATATIHYTTDGSDPTTSGTVQTGASPVTVSVAANTTEQIRAYASEAGKASSATASGTFVTTNTATWINTSGGFWSVVPNWSSNAVANGSGITADFSTLSLPGDTTVVLDSPATVGKLVFADQNGNSSGWIINNANGLGSVLTVDAGATAPSVLVSNQTRLMLPLAGTNGLTVSGGSSGQLTLTAANTYTGATTVASSTLRLLNPGSLSTTASSASVSSGATLLYDNNAANWTVTAPAATLNGGALTNYSAGNNYTVWANSVTVNSASTIGVKNGGVNNAGFYLDGGLKGSAPVTIVSGANGVGVVLRATSSTYSGAMTVNGNASATAGTGSGLVIGEQAGTAVSLPGASITVNGTMELGDNASGMGWAADATSGSVSGMTFKMDTLSGPGVVVANMKTANSTRTLSVGNNNGSGTFSGVIANGANDTLSLVKTGTGTQTLSGANSYSGTTTVSNGMLQVTGSGSVGNGVVSVIGGNMEVDGIVGTGGMKIGSAGTVLGVGQIFGAVTVTNGGTLSAGTNTVTGTLSIFNNVTNSGTISLRINKTGGIRASDLIQRVTTLGFGGTLKVTNITSDATALAEGDAFHLFDAGSYVGQFAASNLPALTGGLVWDMSRLPVNGTLVVAASGNTLPPVFNPPAGNYMGPLSVVISSEAGSTIHYTTDGSDPAASGTVQTGASPVTVMVAANGTTVIRAYASVGGKGNSATVSATYTTVAPPSWLNVSGGTWSTAANWSNNVVASGTNVTADFSRLDLTADTTVNLDTPVVIGNLIFADTDPTNTPANWILANNGVAGNTLNLQATNPTVTVNTNSSVTISAIVAGANGLTKAGPGTLTLSGANTYTNTTTVSDGTLTLGVGGSISASSPISIASGKFLYLSGSAYNQLGAANPGGAVTIAGTLRATTAQAQTMNRAITLNGGTMDSTGGAPSDYGAYFIGYSQTITANGTGNTISGNGKVGISGGTTLTLSTPLSGDTLTVSAALGTGTANGNSGALTKTGLGTLTLSGPNTYTGATTVSNGTLVVSGSLGGASPITVYAGQLVGNGNIAGSVTMNGGMLAVGTDTNTATWNVYNVLTLRSNVNVALRIKKDGGTPANDQIASLTSVNYGSATLTVTNLTSDGTLLAVGDTFQLFSSTAYSGVFATNKLPPLPAGMSWDLSGLATSGTIAVTANAPTPVFDPPAGGYIGGTVTVTITAEAGATIHYTTDGSDPTTSGTVQTAASPATVVVPANTFNEVITAYASEPGRGNSANASATYSTVTTPTWVVPYGGAWSTASYWSNTVVASGANVTADFSQLDITSDTTVSLDAPFTVGSLIFADTDPTNTPANWIVDNSGNTANTLTLQATNPTVTVNTNSSVTISAIVAGTNGLTKAGPGTLTLSGASTYTGVTAVNDGALTLGVGGSISASSPISIASGKFLYLSGSAYNQLGAANPGGAVTIAGTLLATTAQAQTMNRAITLNGGTMDSTGGAPSDYGAFHFGYSQTVTANGTGNTISGNGKVGISGGNTLTLSTPLAGDTLTVSAQLGGGTSGTAGALTKTGLGTVTLSGPNTYTGATTVNQGTLTIGPGGSVNSASLLSIASGAVVNLSQSAWNAFGASQQSGTWTIAGTLRATTAQANTVVAHISLNNGTMDSTGGAPTDYGAFYLAGKTVTANGASNTISGNGGVGINGTVTLDTPLATDALSISAAVGATSAISGGLTKKGVGIVTLSGVNTYTGATTVSNGTLLVNGSLGNTSVAVAGGTLGGTGIINGPTAIQAAGNLAIGPAIGQLTINNSLTLAGTTTMKLDKGNAMNDSVVGLSSITYGGTLALTNLTGTLTNGDTFNLFGATTSFGNFASITPATPGAGLLWNFNPSSGVLSVVPSVNTNPTNITFTVTSGTLSLSWPADHTGWTLMEQTNSLGVGLISATNAWFPVAGSATTNVWTVPVDATKPTVFYRLQYP